MREFIEGAIGGIIFCWMIWVALQFLVFGVFWFLAWLSEGGQDEKDK